MTLPPNDTVTALAVRTDDGLFTCSHHYDPSTVFRPRTSRAARRVVCGCQDRADRRASTASLRRTTQGQVACSLLVQPDVYHLVVPQQGAVEVRS
jgi:hypothetical protein